MLHPLGPALLAVTLMMAAYSLRTWRRNGVACDELLFLPGTSHAVEHEDDDLQQSLGRGSPLLKSTKANNNEGDVAAGVGALTVEMGPSAATTTTTALSSVRSRGLSGDSSVSSINEFANTWDDDAEEYNMVHDDQLEASPLTQNVEGVVPPPVLASRSTSTSRGLDEPVGLRSPEVVIATPQGPVQRFRQNHPQITRIGSFFFFRSSATSTQNAEYAPSGPSVFGAALDLSMPILFNFHLFIEAFNRLGDTISSKILPLIFLSVLMVRTVYPPGRRGRFWATIKCSFMAPFQRTRFRDLYLGDVITSLVRPCQDILFALSYYVTVIYGTATGKYGLNTSGHILQTSWILHNVILPSAAVLPMWFKFLQTLRESYDSGKRWPHLGNAVKYMTAAIVIMYGMTHPENRRSPVWVISFAVCLLYQTWWDTVMDWELFVIAPRVEESSDFEGWWFWRISSVRPNSRFMFWLQRNFFQPIRDTTAWMLRRLPSWRYVQLRPQRLYKTEAFYWRIFVYNTVMRFTWMLCFIPAYHLSAHGNHKVTTFSSDTITYVGVLLPVAEIVRRTLWGFLYLELKTIKMMEADPSYNRLPAAENGEDLRDDSEASYESVDSSKPVARSYLPSWLGSQQQIQQDAASQPSSQCRQCFEFTAETRHKLFVAELSMYAFAFVALGLWATN